MTVVLQDEVGNFRDGAGFIQSAVDVIDWDWARQCTSGQTIGLDVVSVDKQAGRPTVYEGVPGLNLASICGLKFDLQLQ